MTYDVIQKIVLQIWDYLELNMGYHNAIALKEWLSVISGSLAFGIVIFLIISWLNLQWETNSNMSELSTVKIGDHIYSNPHNIRELIDTYIGVVVLKLFPNHRLEPKRVEMARKVIIVFMVLIAVFSIIGLALTHTISLPNGHQHLRDVY
ncbi:MAG: hypothetical protein M0Z55_00085 [Peptococcaceae bacterium]|nr:hypothetical protein [Peptococcaceae bacterium]